MYEHPRWHYRQTQLDWTVVLTSRLGRRSYCCMFEGCSSLLSVGPWYEACVDLPHDAPSGHYWIGEDSAVLTLCGVPDATTLPPGMELVCSMQALYFLACQYT